MTTYTFQPNTSTTIYNWRNSTTWSLNAVPNSNVADVVVPQVTVGATNAPYVSQLFVDPTESFNVRSVSLSGNILVLGGTLSITGALTLGTGGVLSDLGTLTTGSFQNGGLLYGQGGSISSSQPSTNTGQIKADNGSLSLSLAEFTNNGDIVGSGVIVDASGGFTNNGTFDGGAVNVGSGSFTNTGIFRSTLNAANGGFTNFVGGTLTGGTYVGARLNVGSPIVTDAAVMDAGVQSYDSTTASYVPLSQTLRTIASGGFLVAGDYPPRRSTVAGVLQLVYFGNHGSIVADNLTVAAGGTVIGGARITAPVVDNGTITDSAGSSLVIDGTVTGTGIIAVAAASVVSANGPYTGGAPFIITPSEVTLDRAVSANVVFADRYGKLLLEQPGSFTGSITPAGFGGQVDLSGVAFSSVTGYSYAGTSTGGTLTVQQGGSSLEIKFSGNFTTADFRLSEGTRTLSTDPAVTAITLVGPAQTGSAFVVDDSGGLQTFQGTGAENFVATGTTTNIGADPMNGTGAVVVDLLKGTVTKGGLLDAVFTNINGVQLGNDGIAFVLGLMTGTDLLYGAPTNRSATDTFTNEGGTDIISGGLGVNKAIGGTGAQILYGHGGSDIMIGGSGDETLFAGGYEDQLIGGTGSNILVGQGSSVNIMNGTSGTDAFYGGPGTNVFYEGSGLDAFQSNGGGDYIYGGSGTSYIYGGAGTDVITTGAGNQQVTAGSGHTYLNDVAAHLTAGRVDRIDNFAGGQGTDLYLPTAVQGATSFVSQNGGTAVLTTVAGGTAEIFASGTDLATVQAHTHFTL